MKELKVAAVVFVALLISGCGQNSGPSKTQKMYSAGESPMQKHNEKMSKAADDFAKLEPWKKNNDSENKK